MLLNKENPPVDHCPVHPVTNMHQHQSYHSVEFSVDDPNILYQFKIRNSQDLPLFFLVREDSKILNHIKVGTIIKMKFNHNDTARPAEYRKIRIKAIARDNNGKFSGHLLVGLAEMADPSLEMYQFVDTAGPSPNRQAIRLT
jgi:hypothetical protein